MVMAIGSPANSRHDERERAGGGGGEKIPRVTPKGGGGGGAPFFSPGLCICASGKIKKKILVSRRNGHPPTHRVFVARGRIGQGLKCGFGSPL